jgi:hypothetical protein
VASWISSAKSWKDTSRTPKRIARLIREAEASGFQFDD